MKVFRTCMFLCLLSLVCHLNGQSFDKTKGLQHFEGFFDFYYDASEDKIFLEVPSLDSPFLYVYSLSSGIGSNDIGLDRGQLGNEQVVHFERAGNKLLLVQPNLKYRALTDNPLERRSVAQAFARSILFGFTIEAEKNGSFLIDLTPFLIQDAHGVAQRLKAAEQGTYTLDTARSALSMDRTAAFPENIEFDVSLTFEGEPKGDWIKSVVPNPSLVTVAQHHSFVKLPDDGYAKREFDPRCGAYPFSYYDYATPVEEPLIKRFITRHRLKKKDASASVSEAEEPIIYYLDNGTPEPVRSALLEGGRWWNEAFEAIGYKDAFQLKMLPPDADPLDVRYNVIQWVHRSTRGWSYGSSVTDPRTGEIIKGHVSLGSLRIRQDFLIAQALMDKPFAERDDNHEGMLAMALARIRQLSAHEIGHTLGFAHNFAASTNDRASVMDYPHPKFVLRNGNVDLTEAYDTGIGEWDKVTVAYAYSDFPEDVEEEKALNNLLETTFDGGLRYISDQDARPTGGAHAFAHLWDNGQDAAEELERVLDLRKSAITNFSKDNIRSDEPYSVLEDVFVPLYFLHRYQTEATAKLIGGLDYNYAIRGGRQEVVSPLDGASQQQALDQIVRTLHADEIAIPKEKLGLFPPRAFGYPRTRESIRSRAGVSFDALAAAETASDMTLELLLHPERASRLIQQKALDPGNLGLGEVLDAILSHTFGRAWKNEYLAEVQRTINARVLARMMDLAVAKEVHPQVNALAYRRIADTKKTLLDGDQDPFAAELVRRIDRFYERPSAFELSAPPKIPDGSPIGMSCTSE